MKIYLRPDMSVIELAPYDIMNGDSNEAYVDQGSVKIAGAPTANLWEDLYDGSEY